VQVHPRRKLKKIGEGSEFNGIVCTSLYAECNTSKMVRTTRRSSEYQATIENEEATKSHTGTSFIPLPALPTPLSAPPKRKSC